MEVLGKRWRAMKGEKWCNVIIGMSGQGMRGGREDV